MTTIATPDSKQSEAFIATAALFLVFGSSSKEEKASMRLPAAWRDLWAEFSDARKEQADTQDREAIKELRNLVRERRDQELEDGVLLHGAFRGRGTGRSMLEPRDESAADRAKRLSVGPDYYQRIWQEKSSTPKFQVMLVRLLENHPRRLYLRWFIPFRLWHGEVALQFELKLTRIANPDATAHVGFSAAGAGRR